VLPKLNRDINDRGVPRENYSGNSSFKFFNMEEEKRRDDYLEGIQFIIENLEYLIGDINTKILWWWKIGGLVGLALLMIIGYTFCTVSSHLIVLGFTSLFLFCGWMIGNYYIRKRTLQSSNFTLEYKEITDLKVYIADIFLTDAIEIKARGSYSRDRLSEIKSLCELLRTPEGMEKAASILKALDINLNDIQWMEGNKIGIKKVEE
jgi:hypothetical protein